MTTRRVLMMEWATSCWKKSGKWPSIAELRREFAGTPNLHKLALEVSESQADAWKHMHHDGNGHDRRPLSKIRWSSHGAHTSNKILVLEPKYGCPAHTALNVTGESKDGRSFLVDGGMQVPKDQHGVSWKWLQNERIVDDEFKGKSVVILVSRYGCMKGSHYHVDGESRDSRYLLLRGGAQVPKSQQGSGWKWAGSSGSAYKYPTVVDWEPDASTWNEDSNEYENMSIVILLSLYGCVAGSVMRVDGESRDGRNWLLHGGRQVPKAHQEYGWAWTQDSESSSEADGEFDSEDSEAESSEELAPSPRPARQGHCDRFSYDYDPYDDFCDDSHLDYLRETHPDASSDALEDMYMDQMQADAEEFGGYHSYSD